MSDVLWRPDAARVASARMTHYQAWLAREMGVHTSGYQSLWEWSVRDLAAFWQSIARYFQAIEPQLCDPVLSAERMPGACWFPCARINYTEQVFRHARMDQPAVVVGDETGTLHEMTWARLQQEVAALARTLRERGVLPGDRVVAYLPNRTEAIVGFLATAAVGAVWSMCSSDMGVASVVDRFRQISPKVLIATDGYRFGGKHHDRAGHVKALRDALPSLELFIGVPAQAQASAPAGATVSWVEATAGTVPLRTQPLPFDHPLWVVYSSGTTGLPKPIVHGQGGIVLESLKMHALHNDLGPADRFHWYSSTGWIMWNLQVGGLLVGSTICIYDGSPGWPDLNRLWDFAHQAQVTFFGCGAALYESCMKAGIEPRHAGRLPRVRTLGSTGSPLAVPAYEWLQRQFGPAVWIAPISGGTDIASAFVGGVCTLPVYAGEMQARCFGVALDAFDERGHPVRGGVGELVCKRPMPSMPLRFWNDADDRRYRASYFEAFPGVWTHGDWIQITSRGGAIIYGRSDATINRHGIRMGTSELYSAVEALPEIADSLVVDLEYLGRPSYMALFVVMRGEHRLDEALKARITSTIRAALSPRHVPDDVIQIAQVPRTLSGKKLEVPIKRILLGEPVDQVLNPDAVANPASLPWFVQFAQSRQSAT